MKKTMLIAGAIILMIGTHAYAGNGDLGVSGNINGTGNLTVNGNVGIGTTAPTKKLEVNGTMGFTGGVGPFCIFANSCPTGWINKGKGGYISYGGCPYQTGGVYSGSWVWCHPQICCNQ